MSSVLAANVLPAPAAAAGCPAKRRTGRCEGCPSRAAGSVQTTARRRRAGLGGSARKPGAPGGLSVYASEFVSACTAHFAPAVHLPCIGFCDLWAAGSAPRVQDRGLPEFAESGPADHITQVRLALAPSHTPPATQERPAVQRLRVVRPASAHSPCGRWVRRSWSRRPIGPPGRARWA